MTNHQPTVLFFDPITWVDEWSYSIEREALTPLGIEMLIPEDRAARDQELPDADVVVVSSIDQLTAEHIKGLQRCVGIVCYSAGMDAVDLDAAKRAGIEVTNIQAGTDDVADHAIALLLAAWRRLPTMISEARAGRWDLEDHPEFRAVARIGGKTLGIFGAGAIGQAIGVRARAFGMNTIATYRRPDLASEDLPHAPVERLFKDSHAVVLAASLNPTTKEIVDHKVLFAARPGLILVNVGRGGLIVESDLADALDAGHISVAALDVRNPEPPVPGDDLLSHRLDVIQTPHVAGVSEEALANLHSLAAEQIKALLHDSGRL